MIRFNVTKEQAGLIGKIVGRAQEMREKHGLRCDRDWRMSLHMDLSACIANGTPLKLEELLAADDFNFAHDVFGIQRHMDRDDNSPTGGKLLNCFVPRFADLKVSA